MNEKPARPLQFSLRALLVATLVVAALFGALRWMGVSPRACSLILLILVLGAGAAAGLVAAIAAGLPDEGDEE